MSRSLTPTLPPWLLSWLNRRVVRHGLFWATALGLNFLIQLPGHFIVGTKLYVWGLLFNQLPASLLTIYPLLYGLLPRLLRGRPLPLTLALLAGWLLFTVAVTGLTRTFFDFVVQPRLFGIPPGRPFSNAEYFNLSYTWFILMATAGGAVAVKVVNGWYEQRQLSERLRQQQLHAELQLLKAQLQPAFLFSTLHTLGTLTAAKSAQAPGAVLLLADLLRYLLYESPQDAVPLADEVAMLRDYVALEQLRLGTRVEVSLNFSGDLAAHRIAPLLLLPFLENAFRHGTGAGLDCAWVSIDLVARPAGLTFKIINSQPPTAPALREGPGLRAVRQRLAHLYAGRHALRILAEPDTFFMALVLRLGPAPTGTPVPTTDAAMLYPLTQLTA